MKPLVPRCGEKPCRWQCPVQTSLLGFGRLPELIKEKKTEEERRQGERQKREVKMGKQQSVCVCAFQFLHVHKLLTGALVEYVEERSVWHVMGNDDGMRGWRCLTGPENRQNVWMRKDPMET